MLTVEHGWFWILKLCKDQHPGFLEWFSSLELGLKIYTTDFMFLLAHRKSVNTAELNYDRLLTKRALKWLHIRHIEGKSYPKKRARSLAVSAQGFQDKWRLRYFWHYWLEGRRGDHLHQQLLLKRSCKALKEVPLQPWSLHDVASKL